MPERSSTATKDAIALCVFVAAALIVAVYFDVFENFERWASAYERWEVDELVVVPVVLSLAFGLYSWRRGRELKESEQRFTALVQNASDLVTVVDAQGKTVYVSPSVKNLLGYEPEEVVGNGMTDLLHPEDAEKVQKLFAEIMTTPGQTPVVLMRARHRDGSWRHIESVASNLLHDPSLRGIVVNSRDVTERRRAEETSRESEASLVAAQRIAHLGSWDTGQLEGCGFDPRREIRWSDELYRILGHVPGSVVPTLGALMEAIHPDDFERVGKVMRWGTLARERQVEMEHRILRPDGETRTVRARIETDYGPDGEPVSSHGIMLDVTESKKVEEDLGRLASIVESSDDAVYSTDLDGLISTWNRGAERLYGYSAREVVGRPVSLLFPPDQLWEEPMALEKVRRGEGVDRRETVRVAKDGRRLDVSITFSPIRSARGDAMGVSVIARDVTERKVAEERLRRSEQRFRSVVEQAADAIFIHDLDGTLVDVNRRACEGLGYTKDELIGMSVTDVEENFDLAELGRLWESMASGEDVTLDGVHRRKDGSTFPVEIRIGIFQADGSHLVLAVARDVTARREAEEELRRSERNLATAQRIASIGSWELDPVKNEERWSDETFRILGLSPQSVVPSVRRFMDFVHPDDVASFEEYAVDLSGTAPENLEHRIVRPDGEVRVVHNRREVERDASGAAVRAAGTVQDVTEQRAAERRLREAEGKYRTLIEQLPAVTYIHSVDSDTLSYASPQLEDMLGYSPEEYLANPALYAETIHPDDLGWVLAEAKRAEEAGDPYVVECRRVTRDGRVVWVHDEAHLVRDAEGKPLFWQGILQDISRRKRSEEALRQSEERYRAVVEQAIEGIFLFDPRSKRILESNPAFREIFGYDEEELRRITLYDLVPQDTEGVDRNVARALERGHLLVGERSYRRKDGSRVDVEVSGGVISNGGKEVICSVVRDITERKRSEEALRQSEERYRAVVEQAVEGIYLVDPDTKRILESNSAFRRLLGRTGEDLSGMTLYDVVAHDEANVDALARRVEEKGYHDMGERRHRRKDGSLVEVEVSASLISYQGRDALSCVAHNITERKRAERALRESEEMFRAVFESAAMGVALTDREGRFVRVNPALAGFLGYEAEELRGITFMELTHPEDVGPNVSSLRRLLAGELQRYRLEKRYMRPDGSFIWVHVTVSGIRDADGEIRYTLGLIEDITERKRVEEEIRKLNEDLERRVVERTSQLRETIADLEQAQSALRRGEARTRAIVETAPDAIISMTDDGLVRSFNSGAERMFGYAAAEILGRPLTALMPERFRSAHESGLSRHLKTGRSHLIGQGPVELAGLRKDGTEFPLELALGELREEGEVLFTGIVRDITERKEAEEKVRKAEERYRTLVERMPAVTYIQEIGSPDSAMYMSPQIEALTGYTPEACENPDFRWRLVHPADRERLQQSGDEQTGEPGDVFTHEYRVVHRDGRTVWVRNESVLIEDEASGTRYWQGFMVDITERKRAEAILRDYAEKLAQSNRELQDFAYVASHDLQEPLRKVSSFGERLRTKYADALGGQGLDYLRRMEGATVRMQGLIEDLLSLSRITTQANPFEPVDLAEVVPEVLSDLEARLEETGGTVEVGELPTVEADRLQMRQLLQNLIGNALKFHEEDRPPLVKVYGHPEDGASQNGGRPRCTLVVEDDGIGFDERYLSRIFAPFERLHGRGSYEGTGMGLAICRKVVERHGGEITAKSAPGQGARFIITLPMEQIEEGSAREEEI